MTNIQTFNFNQSDIRFVGTPDKPEWVASDIISVLYPQADKRNRSNHLSKIPKDWKGHKKIMTLGGNQEMTTVFEPGLYHLITRSNSELAIPFQKWVFEEVLPSIRKTGSYQTEQSSLNTELLNRMHIAQAASEAIRTSLTNAGISIPLVEGCCLSGIAKTVPELQPQLMEAHRLLAATNTVSTVYHSPTDIGKLVGDRLGIKVSGQKVNKVLSQMGWQYTNPNKISKTEPSYLPSKLGIPRSSNTLASGNGGDNTTYQLGVR
ncbi:MAG: hypothetical protein F6J86_46060 [Symploca sp. SIO1B1]|nr:hypothetical protein [Symploca sp. SIO1B1]